MYRYWNAVSVGYAKYHSIVTRTITLHTIHAGALENYTKSNHIKKNVNRTLIGNRGHSLCTDVPPPSWKIGRGDVCESPLLIVHKLYFCSFADGWKGTCRSKNSSGVCAQASRTSSRNVHPQSRYKISYYSQARSSVPLKMPLMYLLFESWTVGSCRFQIHLSVHSCMRNDQWIHTRFSYEISTSSISQNLM